MPLPRNPRQSPPTPSTTICHENCWAKTTSQDRPGISVLQHCRTAGILARLLVTQMPEWMQESFRIRVGIILTALHDVGKLCPGFQAKCGHWRQTYGLQPADYCGAETDHAKVSQKAIQDRLGENSPLRFWAVIVGAHHGRLKGECITPIAYGDDGGEPWAAERQRLIDELLREFGPLPAEPPSGEVPWDSGPFWCNAGLIAVADWLASDENTFPPDKTLTRAEIEKRAEVQLARVGFKPPGCPAGKRFGDLFPKTPEPKPLQTALAESAQTPGVYIVEGPMGCGKTEAGLIAAYNLLSTGRATGLYFALPTQVTSNRIHLRVREFLSKLDPAAAPRLIHGNSWLQEDTAQVSGVQESEDNAHEGRHDGRDWFASPRRALLAPFGVGTVDQALLGVVAAKHFFVRQFALAGKVVILDEVHSYDLYTGTLLDVLIRRLRELGATVIVLSATLTAARRRDLLGLAESATLSTAYPLLSASRGDGSGTSPPTVLETPIEPGEPKSVTVRFCPSAELATACLEHAARGECVLWIRNTVDEAQATCNLLKGDNRSGGPEIGLLHARFPQFQRETRENRWIDALGKDGARRPANGCVLVSTQIAEQSVDIDADLLVTDLAPTDMLLQRIGRLWRHQRLRPPGVECQVWIAAPPLDACGLRTATAAELKIAFGKSAKVYAPYVLVRTLALWQARQALTLPVDIRPLLEATYAEQPDEPTAWCELRMELEVRKDKMARLAVANSNPWQVQLADEEGVQTRWNGQPTAMLLPMAKVFAWDSQRGATIELLDGSRCEIGTGTWDFATAKAIHRNLVKVPKWSVRPVVGQEMSWLAEYVAGSCVACRLEADGKLSFLPGLAESCLRYTEELGVIIDRTTAAAAKAWSEHTEDDDEFDD